MRRFLVRLYVVLSRFRRGMTLGVRGAVIDGEGRFFLVRHSYLPGWYLPGGGVEPGETVEEALARELLEEGGIELDGPPELFGLYINASTSPRDHVVFYVCRAWRQPEVPKMPNLEIVECGFFAPDALPEETTGGTRRRIAEVAGLAARATEW